MEPKDSRWQAWWVYEGVWWGRKTKMLVFHWFYHYFLKGQEGPEHPKSAKHFPRSTARNRKKGGFSFKDASCRPSELCFLPRRGAHFHKNHGSMSPKHEKCCPNHVRYIKISQKWGRMHQDVMKIVSDASLKSAKEATCSNNSHICDVFWGAACGAWSGWKGKRANDRAIRPKNMTNTGSI